MSVTVTLTGILIQIVILILMFIQTVVFADNNNDIRSYNSSRTCKHLH